jgi:hypothetical protein
MARIENESACEGAMSSDDLKHIGFTDPRRRQLRRRSGLFAQLIAATALAVSIAVAVTAVSIGIAHARTASPAISVLMR